MDGGVDVESAVSGCAVNSVGFVVCVEASDVVIPFRNLKL